MRKSNNKVIWTYVNKSIFSLYITGEGTVMCKKMDVYFIMVEVMSFPYIHLPFTNCNNKVADVWFEWFL